MAEPFCSVVLPTNRVGPWLSQAVQSILANPGEFECVVVLDGIEAPREAWVEDGRVRFQVLSRSRGLSYALNEGIAAARSPLIARMDADDVSCHHRLATQAAYLSSHPETVAVGSAARLMRESGAVTDGRIGRGAGDDVRRDLLKRNTMVHPSMMFRRTAFEVVGGYDESVATMEDYDLWLRLGTVGALAVLPEALLDYRVHGAQMSRSAPSAGAHVDKIGESRLALARTLGVSSVWARAWHKIWVVRQQARSRGLVSAGYVRRLGKSE
jgi:glycosyltransferase involved in cell wall biosynthesis